MRLPWRRRKPADAERGRTPVLDAEGSTVATAWAENGAVMLACTAHDITVQVVEDSGVVRLGEIKDGEFLSLVELLPEFKKSEEENESENSPDD